MELFGPSRLEAMRAAERPRYWHRPRVAFETRAPRELRALHVHSLEARDVKGGVLTGRKEAVVRWLAVHGASTDREIKDGLLGPAADMNAVRPRVNELIEDGMVVEVGEKADHVTGMKVRVVTLVNGRNGGER
jgi:hypothetical protein